MSDLSRNSPTQRAAVGPAGEIIFPEATMKSGVQFYDGGIMFRDPADSALLKASPSGNPMYEAYCVSIVKQLGDGTLRPTAAFGPHPFDNSTTSGEEVPAALPMGWPLYAKDNHTVSIHNGGGLYPQAGWFGGMTGASTPKVICWVGPFCPYALRELLIPVAKGHADLSDAAATMDFTLYTLLGPARVMHPPTIDSLATAFSGGGTATGTLAIGADSDPDAIGDEKSIFTGGAIGAMTAGVKGYAGALLAAGTVIKAQFAADTTVAAFTAGAVVAHLRLRPGS